MENKYFTTSGYKKFTSNILDAKITQEKLVNEYDLNEKHWHQRTNKTISNKFRIENRER